MMKYAGFWPRFSAGLVDAVVMAPLAFLLYWSLSNSHTTALFFAVPVTLLFAAYNIYFVGRWGQTIGKMALKIKVVSLEGNEPGMLRAFYRHSVDFTFSMISTGLTLYALISISSTEYNMLSLNDKVKRMSEFTLSWDKLFNNISFMWMISELIILLMNEKRRSLHDFIAGTLVIHNKNNV